VIYKKRIKNLVTHYDKKFGYFLRNNKIVKIRLSDYKIITEYDLDKIITIQRR
jgi:hypothetical protein